MTSKILRSYKGFSFPEVAVNSFLVTFMACFTSDICLLIFACSVNDQACRSAVRTAAQRINAGQALLFAQSSLANFPTDGVFISKIQLVNGVVWNDYGGNPPSGMTPYVQCTTQVTVTLPMPLYFFDASFARTINFAQTYTSPIIKTKYILN